MAPSIPEAFWPVSITGWISLITSIGAALAVAIGYGKWLEKLNGMGARVKVLEEAKVLLEGKDIERTRQLDRLLGQHEALIGQIGEAKRSADSCHEQAADQTLQIGSQISQMHQTVNDMRLDLAQRLTAVETALRLKGE